MLNSDEHFCICWGYKFLQIRLMRFTCIKFSVPANGRRPFFSFWFWPAAWDTFWAISSWQRLLLRVRKSITIRNAKLPSWRRSAFINVWTIITNASSVRTISPWRNAERSVCWPLPSVKLCAHASPPPSRATLNRGQEWARKAEKHQCPTLGTPSFRKDKNKFSSRQCQIPQSCNKRITRIVSEIYPLGEKSGLTGPACRR